MRAKIGAMLTLTHAPRSRSTGMLWLLEEAGAQYHVHYVDIRRGDGSGHHDAANPHPHGKVPVLIDGEETLFERIAICEYVREKFPEAKLGPAPGQKGRGEYLTLLAYYAGVIEPSFTSKFMNITPPRGTAGWVAVDEVMPFINAQVAKHDYIAGNEFTTADILYSGAFALFMNSPLMMGHRTKVLEDYVARCTARPAHAHGSAKDNPPENS
jgi:glutathione S-transferase